MSDPIFFAPLRVPLTDARTGLMSREWYLFFQAMFLRIGGTQSFTPDDLQIMGDVNDATDDGNDIRASAADLERAVSLDEPSIPTDLGELQMLSASFVEDPVPIAGKPTAKVGPTVVNGTALTYMPSDAAPPIDLTATYPWTGLHSFSLVIAAAAGIRTYAGVTASTASGTPVTLQALPTTGLGTYIVSVDLAGVNDAANYNAVAMVCVNGTNAKITTLVSAGLMTITLSGLNVQATQGSGASNAITYSIIRIA